MANGGSQQPILSGTTDLPLTPLGHEQAVALARAAAVRASLHILSSPLTRARVTAQYVADGTGMRVECNRRLQEIDCGELEGIRIDVLRSTWPSVWSASQSQTDESFRWPGGESYADLRARSVSAIADVASRHRGESILIVTHAGVISQVMGYLRGVSAAHWAAFRPGNASITEIDWTGTSGTVVSFDRREHLPTGLQT